MPHLLMENDREKHPNAFMAPFMISMRYRCSCANNEVITINTVFDLDMLGVDWEKRRIVNEDTLHWTIKRMIRDMLIEIRQHTGEGAAKPPAAPSASPE
jgi:hypothetical protein